MVLAQMQNFRTIRPGQFRYVKGGWLFAMLTLHTGILWLAVRVLT